MFLSQGISTMQLSAGLFTSAWAAIKDTIEQLH